MKIRILARELEFGCSKKDRACKKVLENTDTRVVMHSVLKLIGVSSQPHETE
jgi:hypothetical protein